MKTSERIENLTITDLEIKENPIPAFSITFICPEMAQYPPYTVFRADNGPLYVHVGNGKMTTLSDQAQVASDKPVPPKCFERHRTPANNVPQVTTTDDLQAPYGDTAAIPRDRVVE